MNLNGFETGRMCAMAWYKACNYFQSHSCTQMPCSQKIPTSIEWADSNEGLPVLGRPTAQVWHLADRLLAQHVPSLQCMQGAKQSLYVSAAGLGYLRAVSGFFHPGRHIINGAVGTLNGRAMGSRHIPCTSVPSGCYSNL